MNSTVVPFRRREELVDTSGFSRLSIIVDASIARQSRDMPDALASLIARAIMGRPVPRDELEAWGLHVGKLYSMDDPELLERCHPPAED
jgi:hypothetical protein